MKKMLLLVPVVLLASTLAGCSVGPLPGSPPAAANGAASTPAAVVSTPGATSPSTKLKDLDASVDVCAVVPVSMVRALTGRPYVSTKLVKAGDGNSCAYFGKNVDTLEMELGWYDEGHYAYTGLVKHYDAGVPPEPIRNLGDEADAFPQGVVVRYGDDNIISFDDVHEDYTVDLQPSVYIKLIETLEAAR
jgi:hypothetical protein